MGFLEAKRRTVRREPILIADDLQTRHAAFLAILLCLSFVAGCGQSPIAPRAKTAQLARAVRAPLARAEPELADELIHNYIVQLKTTGKPWLVEEKLERLGLVLVSRLDALGFVRLYKAQSDELLDRIRRLAAVKYALYDNLTPVRTPIMQSLALTEPTIRGKISDPYYPLQWSLVAIDVWKQWGAIEEKWPTRTKGTPRLAILDTGIEPRLEDFGGFVWTGSLNPLRNGQSILDYSGHGTRVASILGARGNNRRGIAGVLWKGKVAIMVVVNGSTDTPLYPLLLALYGAVDNGADIVNMSLEFNGSGTHVRLLEDAVRYAADKGVIIVCAAGNSGTSLDGYDKAWPASFADRRRQTVLPNVVAVAAIEKKPSGGYVLHRTSNYGAETVVVAAPGGDVPAIDLNGDVVLVTGTSFAAPHVTAALSLTWDDIGGPEIKRTTVVSQIHERTRDALRRFLERHTVEVAYLSSKVRDGRVLRFCGGCD